jgi:hypothetical protein
MKKYNIISWANTLAFAAIFTVTACEQTQSIADGGLPVSTPIAATAGLAQADYALLSMVFDSTAAITEQEASMLSAMKEEEKLARDVYMNLYEKWGSNVFLNISKSEQRHVDAVVKLMAYYNMPDTVVEEPGLFASEELKALYDTLTGAGSVSEAEAFKTGALIEDMDIHDLDLNLAVVTNANVALVFGNLKSGSYNHLVAFTRQLTAMGITYTPVFISAEEYNLILTTTPAPGKHRGRNW